MLNIYVASENITKLNTTYSVFKKQYPLLNIKVFGLKTNSNVPNQPVGIEQTKEGCKNRLIFLLNHVESNKLRHDFLVSIENGIKEPSIDFCCVNIYCNGTILTDVSDLSDEVSFPKNFYNESILSEQKITAGELIEKYYGYPNGEWHQNFGVSRKTQIENTITKILNRQ